MSATPAAGLLPPCVLGGGGGGLGQGTAPESVTGQSAGGASGGKLAPWEALVTVSCTCPTAGYYRRTLTLIDEHAPHESVEVTVEAIVEAGSLSVDLRERDRSGIPVLFAGTLHALLPQAELPPPPGSAFPGITPGTPAEGDTRANPSARGNTGGVSANTGGGSVGSVCGSVRFGSGRESEAGSVGPSARRREAEGGATSPGHGQRSGATSPDTPRAPPPSQILRGAPNLSRGSSVLAPGESLDTCLASSLPNSRPHSRADSLAAETESRLAGFENRVENRLGGLETRPENRLVGLETRPSEKRLENRWDNRSEKRPDRSGAGASYASYLPFDRSGSESCSERPSNATEATSETPSDAHSAPSSPGRGLTADREGASTLVTAGETANTTVKNSRASRESGLWCSHSHGESIAAGPSPAPQRSPRRERWAHMAEATLGLTHPSLSRHPSIGSNAATNAAPVLAEALLAAAAALASVTPASTPPARSDLELLPGEVTPDGAHACFVVTNVSSLPLSLIPLSDLPLAVAVREFSSAPPLGISAPPPGISAPPLGISGAPPGTSAPPLGISGAPSLPSAFTTSALAARPRPLGLSLVSSHYSTTDSNAHVHANEDETDASTSSEIDSHDETEPLSRYRGGGSAASSLREEGLVTNTNPRAEGGFVRCGRRFLLAAGGSASICVRLRTTPRLLHTRAPPDGICTRALPDGICANSASGALAEEEEEEEAPAGEALASRLQVGRIYICIYRYRYIDIYIHIHMHAGVVYYL